MFMFLEAAQQHIEVLLSHLDLVLPTQIAHIRSKVCKDLVAWIIQDHLYHLKNPHAPSETFAGSCLQGLLAALGVFGRALHVLGRSSAMEEGDEDGFLLWRVEMGVLAEAGLWSQEVRSGEN